MTLDRYHEVFRKVGLRSDMIRNNIVRKKLLDKKREKKMIIGIDLDNTVIKTIEAWIEQFHPEIDIEQINRWEFYKDKKFKLSKYKFMKELENLNYKRIELMDGFYLMLLELLKNQHSIVFITDKTPKMMEWTLKWLKRNKLDYIPILNTSEKLKERFDVLIDDNPSIAHDDRVITFSQPWNKDIVKKERLNSWDDIINILF